jgi:hypothetical protein
MSDGGMIAQSLQDVDKFLRKLAMTNQALVQLPDMEPALITTVRGIGRSHTMRMYISEESSKKLERVSVRTGDSPENALRDAVDCNDEDETEAPQDNAGASDVPKVG